MAVALDEAAVQKLGPSAQKQIAATGGVPAETPAVTPKTKAEPKAKAGPKPKPLPQPTSGASDRTRAAARQTRVVAAKIAPRGTVNRTVAGHPTIRGFIWLFVWLGVLFYLLGHPTTLPRLVSMIFAPIDGVLAVARGGSSTTKKAAV